MGWRSANEAEITLLVVRDNPKRPDESTLMYVERIAVLSGLMPPGRAAFPENAKLGGSAQASPEPAAFVKSNARPLAGHSGAQPWSAKSWDSPWEGESSPIRDSDERREVLRRQAEEITK